MTNFTVLRNTVKLGRGARHHQERWLVVGLGNPGKKYARTRHNVGAWLLDVLRKHWELPTFELDKPSNALVSYGKLSPSLISHLSSLILTFPQTFMNTSGRAVAHLLRKHRVPLDQLIVLHDDKDIAFGNLKLGFGRSAAGHRGVQSIIDTLRSKEFWRLRIGIGGPPAGVSTETYVLQPFQRAEREQLAREVFPRIIEKVEVHLRHENSES